MDNQKYDSSWDLDYGEKGYDKDAYDRKSEEWEERDWIEWLQENLTFPFKAERMEDDVDMFAPKNLQGRNPFKVGCHVTVTGITDLDCDPDFEGVIINVVGEKGKKGAFPLQDLEVQPKTDPNYWPVREFVVWYANR